MSLTDIVMSVAGAGLGFGLAAALAPVAFPLYATGAAYYALAGGLGVAGAYGLSQYSGGSKGGH
ncbi:MAG TPA: hypothetical protein VI564_01485 [Candidatus Nanoarchaeia archaeon]|nr:hypothetical protein [Candidatus Nanoarchaeia archaeon]